VTDANIFNGDTNFLFSMHTSRKESQASIISTYMMQAKHLSEDHESRNRLTERIAKELVPASLKSLGIPRSIDPTCPYSYSNGVGRLDEKTLQLSDSVRLALEKIRAHRPTKGALLPHL
jgi:predicted Zn-dependent protease